ncbi:MAG: N-acetylmuramoyl-L-alanine amidase [Akkermansiaceae bacterium]|nr:N-acetylmuramoyl-L-alanine amidase [Akkermansiaceae bacterium]
MIGRLLLSCLTLALMCCAQVPTRGEMHGPVVLDIGHFIGGDGAQTPSPVRGKVITECTFWYQYAAEVKQVVQAAGYDCTIVNRGNAPTKEPLAGYARRAGVVHLQRPDVNATRYPSRYFADRVASGMVSADYAISRRAACMVFLHHNSTSSRWTSGASPSMVLCNKFNGRTLAECLCRALNTEILNHGMPNGGRECRPEVSCVDAQRAAGWLNACDDAGIPAAVIEAAFLNNRAHAEFLAQDAQARRYAQTVGHGIVAYLRAHGHEPRHVRANPDVPDQGSFGYAAESRRLKVPGAKRLLP